MTQLNKIYQVAFLQTKDEEILLEGTVHDETFKQKREELRKLQTTSVGKEFAAARARADKTAQEWSEAKAKRQGNKRKAAMWVFRTQRRPVFRTRRRSSKFRLLEVIPLSNRPSPLCLPVERRKVIRLRLHSSAAEPCLHNRGRRGYTPDARDRRWPRQPSDVRSSSNARGIPRLFV